MTLISKPAWAIVITLSLAVPAWSAQTKSAQTKTKQSSTIDAKSEAVKSIVDIHNRIEREGFEKVLREAKWLKSNLDSSHLNSIQSASDNPFDDCFLNPAMNGCTGNDTWPGYDPFSQKNLQLRDDGIQIVAVEVLYQTLTYFKVKHYFGKVKKPANGNNSTFGDSSSGQNYAWTFKVIDPKEDAYYNDLDTEAVLGALREFRKYVIALLCNDPNPNRMLAMMNKFDVGQRFRWDMAWALLGNQLPDAPNRYMVFGAKWRKFSAAMDGIENTSLMRLKNPNGNDVPFNPSEAVAAGVAKSGGSMATLGFISREIVGLVRLAGDIIAEFLNLFCISDLHVDVKAETKKQQAIYKLLDIKKRAYDRYGPLKPVLDEMGKKASEATGRTVSFFP